MMTRRAGVDVSAKQFTVCFETAKKTTSTRSFTNRPSGFEQAIQRLTSKGRSSVRVCMESTGHYGLGLALALHRDPRAEVMVANPHAASSFAKAIRQRSKTDPLDAATLLEFVRRMPFAPWKPPAQECLQLRSIAALTRMAAQETNRCHAADLVDEVTDVICNDIQVNLRHLRRRTQRLEQQALDLVWQHQQLRADLLRLTSIKGVAKTSGIRILAELCVLPEDMTPRQWVAHAGLDPRQIQSGTSVNKPAHISRNGSTHLRAALYMPAIVAVQYEPRVRAFHKKLVKRGKKPIQSVVAVMRKLLHSIHGMLRHAEDFDGEKFYPSTSEKP